MQQHGGSGGRVVMEIDDKLTAELREAFAYLDKDGDGHIGTTELLRAMLLLRVPGASNQVAREMVRFADGDADGRLDFGDFVTHVCRGLLHVSTCSFSSRGKSGAETVPPNEYLRATFQLFKNDRGGLSAEAVAAFLTGLGEPTSPRMARRMIDEAAGSSESEIDYEAFSRIIMGGLRDND